MKRVLFTALLLSVFALAAEVPAFNAEKAAGKGAVFRDGVFTVETTKPSKYANMSFSLGDMPYRTDLQLEFEYRSTVLTGGPERYIGVNFSPRKMPKTVTMLPVSKEWKAAVVPLGQLASRIAGKLTPIPAGTPLADFIIYSRLADNAPGTARLEVRSVRFAPAAAPAAKAKAAKAAAEPMKFDFDRALDKKRSDLVITSRDGVFTAENKKDDKYTTLTFDLQNMAYQPDLRVRFEYRSAVLTGGPERYVGVNFFPRKAGSSFTSLPAAKEWKEAVVDFHGLRFHNPVRLAKGTPLGSFTIYVRREDGAPGKARLEVRNLRFERDAKYNPLDGVRVSYSAKPLISWRAAAGAEKYRVACLRDGKTVLSSETDRPYFVPVKPLDPGLYVFKMTALPSAKEIAEESILVPDPCHTWTMPEYDFAGFAAMKHPRLKRLAAYWNPDVELARRRGLAFQKLKLPPNPLPYRDGADPKLRARIEWYGQVGGGVINRAGSNLQTVGQAAVLTGDPELIANAKRLALEIAQTWDPNGGSSMKNTDLHAASVLRGISWCYDAAYNDMTPEERKIVADCIRVRCTQYWNNIFPFRLNESQNHPWDRVEAAAFGALALAEEPGMEMRYNYCANIYAYRILPSLGFKGENNEGLKYWSYGFGLAMRFIDTARYTVGLSFFSHPWLKYTARFPMYGMPAGGVILSFGDNGRPNHAGVGPLNRPFTGKLAAAADDPAALWYAGYAEKEGVLAKPPVAELVPQSIAYEHLGMGIFNTFLADGRENVALAFHSGKYFAGHQHADQNSFMLNAYGDKLAIDGGYYDHYNSRHFKAYSVQTQAHNTVLVNGKGQALRKEGADGVMTGYFDSPHFGYVAGDASNPKLYHGQIDRFDRDIVFFKPDFVAVYDRLVAPKPAKFQWLLHSHSDKPIDYKDGAFSFARPLAQMAGKMFLPDGMTANVARSYAPDDDPVLGYSVTKDPNPQPEWTLTVENPEPARATEFFSVMRIARTGEPCDVEWTRELTDTGAAAVSRQAAVIFRRTAKGKAVAGKFETDARAAAVIFNVDGSVFDAMLADGSYLKYDGKTLLDAGKKVAGLAMRTKPDVTTSKVDVKIGDQTVKADYRVEKLAFGREIHYVSGMTDIPDGYGWRFAGGEGKAPVSLILIQNRGYTLAQMPETRQRFLAGGKLGFSFVSAKPFSVPSLQALRKLRIADAKMMPVGWQPPAGAVKFEAENAEVATGSAVTEREHASGGKASISWERDGQWGRWRFSVPKDGRYDFYLCVAGPHAAIQRELQIDGNPIVGDITGVTFGATGGYGYSAREWRWVKFPGTAELKAGEHVFTLAVIQGSANHDAFALVPVK